jgi:uncharacterized protein YqhQ
VFNSALGDVTKQGESMAPIGEVIGNIAKAIVMWQLAVQVLVPVIKFVFPLFIQYIQNLIDGYIKIYNTIQYVFSARLQKDIVGWWTTTVAGIIGAINSAMAIGTLLVLIS